MSTWNKLPHFLEYLSSSLSISGDIFSFHWPPRLSWSNSPVFLYLHLSHPMFFCRGKSGNFQRWWNPDVFLLRSSGFPGEKNWSHPQFFYPITVILIKFTFNPQNMDEFYPNFHQMRVSHYIPTFFGIEHLSFFAEAQGSFAEEQRLRSSLMQVHNMGISPSVGISTQTKIGKLKHQTLGEQTIKDEISTTFNQ